MLSSSTIAIFTAVLVTLLYLLTAITSTIFQEQQQPLLKKVVVVEEEERDESSVPKVKRKKNLIFIQQFSDCQSSTAIVSETTTSQVVSGGGGAGEGEGGGDGSNDVSSCEDTIRLLQDICGDTSVTSVTSVSSGSTFACIAILSKAELGDYDDNSSRSDSSNTTTMWSSEEIKSSVALEAWYEVLPLFMSEKGLLPNLSRLLCNGRSPIESDGSCGAIDHYIHLLYASDIIIANKGVGSDILDFILEIDPLHVPLLLDPSEILSSDSSSSSSSSSSFSYCLERLRLHKKDISNERKILLDAALGWEEEEEREEMDTLLPDSYIDNRHERRRKRSNSQSIFGEVVKQPLLSEVARQYYTIYHSTPPLLNDDIKSAASCGNVDDNDDDGSSRNKLLTRSTSAMIEILRHSLHKRGYFSSIRPDLDHPSTSIEEDDDKDQVEAKIDKEVVEKASIRKSESGDVRNSRSNNSSSRRKSGSGVDLRLLCLTYTIDANHASILGILSTWGQHCNGYLAFSNVSDLSINTFRFRNHKEDYNNIWMKVAFIWQLVASSSLVDDFDYFMIGGDDLFVIIENLREYLAALEEDVEVDEGVNVDEGGVGGSGVDRRKFVYLGRPFYHNMITRFNTGGAGYVLDRNSLQVLAHLLNTPPYSTLCMGGLETSMEDVMVARCLALAGIYPTSSISSDDKFESGDVDNIDVDDNDNDSSGSGSGSSDARGSSSLTGIIVDPSGDGEIDTTSALSLTSSDNWNRKASQPYRREEETSEGRGGARGGRRRRRRKEVFHPFNLSDTFEGTVSWYVNMLEYSNSVLQASLRSSDSSSSSSSSSSSTTGTASDLHHHPLPLLHSFSEKSISFQSIKTSSEMICIYNRLYSPNLNPNPT